MITRGKEFERVSLPFKGEWTCMHCPVQASGVLPGGREWYFRARGGGWYLECGQDLPTITGVGVIASGRDPFGGHMPAHHAARLIRATLGLKVKTLCE